MNIHFEWPTSYPPVTLGRTLTAQNPAAFDVVQGIFGVHDGQSGHDAIVFWWNMSRPVMLNLCVSHLCQLDGAEVAYGSVNPLRDKSKIQVGHFRLGMRCDADSTPDEDALYQLINPDEDEGAVSKVTEIEDILPNGGNYINDLHYVNDVILTQDKGDDILKTLEVEYKRFLIWQEQEGDYYDGMNVQSDFILKTDHLFEENRTQIEEKTLTECIVAKDFLMEKLWPELENDEQWAELFAEEEKVDLLSSLSPEHIVAKNKHKVPDLVFQDFNKTGLDSYY